MNSMADLAQRLAVYLPDWVPEASENNLVGILRRPDGAGIFLRLMQPYSNNSRVEVSGDYPKMRRPDGPRHTITVLPSRTPRDVADDIQRRFLPEYDKLYDEALVAAEADRCYWQQKAEDRERVAELLGIRYQPPSDPKDVKFLDWAAGEFYARVRAENGRVYLDRVSMSLAQFERFVASIRET